MLLQSSVLISACVFSYAVIDSIISYYGYDTASVGNAVL